MITLRSRREIQAIKAAGRIVRAALKETGQIIAPGVTTVEIDALAERVITKRGAVPAFKGYRGFPANICASVNEVVVHGIPSGRRLKAGDLISVDIGVQLDGFYADAAMTFPVGEVSGEAQRLMKVTREALGIGIARARPGNRLSDISNGIQRCVEAAGFSVVRAFVGHGIGSAIHEEPEIPNYGVPHRGVRLEKGMVLAIEPMVNAGGFSVEILDDGWTAVTKDRSLSAHFEDTVAVGDDGAEVLT